MSRPVSRSAGTIAEPERDEADRAEAADRGDGRQEERLDRDAAIPGRSVDVADDLERPEDRRGEEQDRGDPDERPGQDRGHADDGRRRR